MDQIGKIKMNKKDSKPMMLCCHYVNKHFSETKKIIKACCRITMPDRYAFFYWEQRGEVSIEKLFKKQQ